MVLIVSFSSYLNYNYHKFPEVELAPRSNFVPHSSERKNGTMSMPYPEPLVVIDTRAWWQRIGLAPNAVTLIRLALCWVPAWMILLYPSANVEWVVWTCVVLGTLLLTDFVDGQLARWLNSVTDFGKMLDPLADKFILLGVFYALVEVGILAPPWGWLYFWFNVVREVGMMLLRPLASVVIPANWEGKLKFGLQAFGAGCAVLAPLHVIWTVLAWTLLLTALPFSLSSAKDYVQTALAARNNK